MEFIGDMHIRYPRFAALSDQLFCPYDQWSDLPYGNTSKYIDSSIPSIYSFIRLAFLDNSSAYSVPSQLPYYVGGYMWAHKAARIYWYCVVDQNDSHLPVRDCPFGNSWTAPA